MFGRAALKVRAFAVTATAVVADGDEVWYIRGNMSDAGIVGHITSGADIPREVAAGPFPVALAVTSDGLYVLESMPDTGKQSDPRTDVLERLDRTTLQVVASAPVTALPTDVAVAGDLAWVAGTGGAVSSFDASTLAPRWKGTVTGRGVAALAADARSIWMLNGLTEDHVFLVHRWDAASPSSSATYRVPGSGDDGVLALGQRAWVETPDEEAVGSLIYPLAADGSIGHSLSTPRIAGLAAADGMLWWLTTEGEVNRIDETTLARADPVSVGVGQGIDIAVGSGRIWAAADALVLLTPGS